MQDAAELTRRLADLVVGYGANVQPGQIVMVNTYVGLEDANRAIARSAYERGARWVDVLAFDPWIKRERLLHAAEETLSFVPPWLTERLDWLSAEEGARISLRGGLGAAALEGVDPRRAGLDLLPNVSNTTAVINAGTTNWCVSVFPTPTWARAVYPELEPDAAYAALWDAVAHVCRLDAEDPAAAWGERSRQLAATATTLTGYRFDAIHLAGPGTDLTVGLLPSSSWHGGDHHTAAGLRHAANIPTEEVFTTPDPLRVDGHVTATRPLNTAGAQIDGIRIGFEGGRAVRVDADRGAETLRGLVATDEGAAFLGELALVDREGRIGTLGTVFNDSLLDENAASHVALGNAYALAVDDPGDVARMNTSAIHIDFMIGSPEVAVDGITRDGVAEPLLRDGIWQI